MMEETTGFVYLLQPATSIGTKCFKIGCSEDLSLNRLKGYLNGSKFICIFNVKSPFLAEKIIKNTFDLQYTPYAGREYYQGDEKELTLLFLKCISYILENSKNTLDQFPLDNQAMTNDECDNDNIEHNKLIINDENILNESVECDNIDEYEDKYINIATYNDFLKVNDWLRGIILTSDKYEGYIKMSKYQPWYKLYNKNDINFDEDQMETLDDFLDKNLNDSIFKHKIDNTLIHYEHMKNKDFSLYNVYDLKYNMTDIMEDIKSKCMTKKVKFYNFLYNEYLISASRKYFIFDMLKFNFTGIENINTVICGSSSFPLELPNDSINIDIIDNCLKSFINPDHVIKYKIFMYHLLIQASDTDNIFVDCEDCYLTGVTNDILYQMSAGQYLYDDINTNNFKNEIKFKKYIEKYKQNPPRCVIIHGGNNKIITMLKKYKIKNFIITDFNKTKTKKNIYDIKKFKNYFNENIENIKNQCVEFHNHDIYDIFTSSRGLIFNFIKWCSILPMWKLKPVNLTAYNNALSWSISKPHIQTCKHGPNFFIKESITSHGIINIINKLHEIFGNEYIFEPEPISEGGIVFKEWPGKQKTHYKSFRLRCNNGKWPHINENVIKEWTEKESFVIWHGEGTKINLGSYLKAFYGAPKWTKDEIYKFTVALAEGGIILKNNL